MDKDGKSKGKSNHQGKDRDKKDNSKGTGKKKGIVTTQHLQESLGDGTEALVRLLNIVAWTVELFAHLKVEFVLEIVPDASKRVVSEISQLIGATPCFFCASQVCYMRRPRPYWTSFDLFCDWEGRIVSEELWNRALLEADVGNVDRWIVEVASRSGGNERARLPTAARENRGTSAW